MTTHTLPYGTWPSPLSATQVASANPRMNQPLMDGGHQYWLESRPEEKGRITLLCRGPSGQIEECLPAPWSARSRVNEYGGGAYCVAGDDVYFVNAECQQVYHLHQPTGSITELTETPNCRYAQLVLDKKRRRLLAVCETHTDQAVTHTLVAIATHSAFNPVTPLAQGHDFYAYPTLSPSGEQLAFITWNNPNMPWDNTQLWVATLLDGGAMSSPKAVSSGQSSVFQPEWLDDARLVWIDDCDEWWRPVLWNRTDGSLQVLTDICAEFATPLWTLDMRTYGVLDSQTLLVTYTQNNHWQIALLRDRGQDLWELEPIEAPVVTTAGVVTQNGQALLLGASATTANALWQYSNGQLKVLVAPKAPIDEENIAQGEHFSFQTTQNETAHAIFYPPKNSRFYGPENDAPPAIFICHGGPTGQTDLALNLKIQYWTSRGFAVVDVNYRGSTGYGRTYRQALAHMWGVKDVEDMCSAADHATQAKWVAPQRIVIRGSSAGGFTVLAALTQKSKFQCGVSLYGIGDLETLATDTHKFEARYLDSLIGPYPEKKAVYQSRSPIHHVDDIDCPMLVFQGLQDKVVPPNQAQAMVSAVRAKGLPVVYVTYQDEGHGFRSTETIVNQLETELAFYIDVLDLH